ncbi:MAG: SdpI family protein [Rhodothermales bacterium]
MKTRELIKTDWPAWLLLALPFVVLAVIWDRLPDELPVHWNARGEIDRYDAKGFSALMIPLIGVGSYLLMLAVPWIDPKRQTDANQKAIRAFRFIFPLLMTSIFGVLCLNWLGYAIDMGQTIFVLIAALFLVIGNFLGAIKPNYFIGIRTPWTLESADIWRKTHRMAGKLWVFGSLVMIAIWFFVPSTAYPTVFIVGVVILTLVPVGYSFYLYMAAKRAARSES